MSLKSKVKLRELISATLTAYLTLPDRVDVIDGLAPEQTKGNETSAILSGTRSAEFGKAPV